VGDPGLTTWGAFSGGCLARLQRTTAISGWRLETLIAIRGGLVLFRNFSGEPDNFRIEHLRNPLEPLQSAGNQIVGGALR
jgi:hypothetical protein